MKRTATAIGRTFAVAVPTLRRDDVADAEEQNDDLRKSEEFPLKP